MTAGPAIAGRRVGGAEMKPSSWTHRNLITQGYRLGDAELSELSVAVRFSTGLCLALVVAALMLESPAVAFALAAIGLVAGFSARHPFDHLWNRLVRHLVGGPALPPNPQRRRHAFKVATVLLIAVGALLVAGEATAALVLGGLMVAACAAVTAVNLCIPSEALAWWERLPEHTRPGRPGRRGSHHG